MQVFIRNKIVSLGGSSTVVNENKQPVYEVQGKFFTFTRKKYVKDMNGNTLYIVRNKFFNWFVRKAYVYDANKQKIAMVKDKMFNFNNEFFVEGYRDQIKFEGKFFHLTSQILRNGQIIGTLRREITLFKDAFSLEANPEDIPFLIALVIAIDNIVDKKTNTK